MTLTPETEAAASSAMPAATPEDYTLQPGHDAGDPIQKEADRGSWSEDEPGRPLWDMTTSIVREYKYRRADGSYSFSVFKGKRADGDKTFLTGRSLEGSGYSELQLAIQSDPDDFYRFPGMEHVRKGAGTDRHLLYRLPELLAALAERPTDPLVITEGEKDADTVIEHGFIATTNANGARSGHAAFNSVAAGRDVIVLVDNDSTGEDRGEGVSREVSKTAASVTCVKLPGLPLHGDITDYFEAGHTRADFLRVVQEAKAGRGGGAGVGLTDFYANMPQHNYIFAPTGETWPASSVNSRIPPVEVTSADDEPRRIPANQWIDRHRPVEQMTWAPGEPQVVPDRLIADGGWIIRPGCNVFNLYRPPAEVGGDASKAGMWVDHVHRVYPDEAEHIINWLAHRVQRPQEKINHALVLGGAQGIGKDTILEPAKLGIGPWNFQEVSPQQMLGRFNGFVKSVILRVSEARDLGDVDRFAFYEHSKTYTAAPPDVLRVDEKNLREHAVFNVCGVIITSNNKTNGIYLPADDRRHFVAWSDLNRSEFLDDYWADLWGWYRGGGDAHVVAFLAARDLSSFNAKAPPRKTAAFWDIVSANATPEEAELVDALDRLGNPDAVTLRAIAEVAEPAFGEWVLDRKNSRKVPHKMEECGYRPMPNPTAKSKLWKVDGKAVMIYVQRDLSVRDGTFAAEKRAREGNNVPM